MDLIANHWDTWLLAFVLSMFLIAVIYCIYHNKMKAEEKRDLNFEDTKEKREILSFYGPPMIITSLFICIFWTLLLSSAAINLLTYISSLF